MDIVIVVAYAVVTAAAVAGGIVGARVLWRRLGRGERQIVQRATHDRRRRAAPVMWDRRVRPRRLEDVARGFLDGFGDGVDAGAR